MQKEPRKNEWLVLDKGQRYGPVGWDTILQWVKEERLSPESYVWKEGMNYWVPLTNYVKIRTRGEEEARALIPSRYDAMVWGGAGLFFVSVLVFVINIFAGLPLLVIANILPIAGVYLDFKKEEL